MTKLVKKNCGIHYGLLPGPCSKCRIVNQHREKHPKLYQYSGTPWAAVIGSKQETRP